MKTLLIVLLIIFLIAIIALFALGRLSAQGQPNGLVNGKLASCPDKPNCVCSEYADDTGYAIEPLVITDSKLLDMGTVQSIVQGMGGKVVSMSDQYLAATFTSGLFGFVDDLEIRLDSHQQKLHFRSASRVGHSDLGVNKKRVAALKKRIDSIQ